MKLLFLLSKEQIPLAVEEVLQVTKGKNIFQREHILIVETSSQVQHNIEAIVNRLAFTRRVLLLLFSCRETSLQHHTETFDWEGIYQDNYCVRVFKNDKSNAILEQKYAKTIWRKITAPKVNLKNPTTRIELHIHKQNSFAGIVLAEQKEDFNVRKVHRRPAPHPSSMHPKLARAVVNLTGINRKNAVLIDPMCGSGGILLEAGIMGFLVQGYDIDKNMLERCRINLLHYGVKKRQFHLKQLDATKLKKGLQYVACDLPYGKSTILKNKQLYTDFLRMLDSCLKGRAVLGFPDTIDVNGLVRSSKTKLRIIKKFTIYLHKKLSKKIIIIEKNH